MAFNADSCGSSSIASILSFAKGPWDQGPMWQSVPVGRLETPLQGLLSALRPRRSQMNDSDAASECPSGAERGDFGAW